MNERVAAKMEAAKDRRIAELEAEVARLRLLETLWKARVTWASVQGDGPTERANWEAYDKAREAYEAAGGAL